MKFTRAAAATIAAAIVSFGAVHAAPGAVSNSDAARAKISDALSKGDVAAAAKMMSEIQAAPSPGLAAANLAAAGGNTGYEEIKGCGFYPQETRLECIIQIKRSSGYGGPVGSPGSMEHVYFCVDWNGDNNFTQYESVGQGSVQMHDDPSPKPGWNYAVYRDINLFGGPRTTNSGGSATTQSSAPTVQVKAILSWSYAPTGCNYVPVYGNVYLFPVRMDPIR